MPPSACGILDWGCQFDTCGVKKADAYLLPPLSTSFVDGLPKSLLPASQEHVAHHQYHILLSVTALRTELRHRKVQPNPTARNPWEQVCLALTRHTTKPSKPNPPTRHGSRLLAMRGNYWPSAPHQTTEPKQCTTSTSIQTIQMQHSRTCSPRRTTHMASARSFLMQGDFVHRTLSSCPCKGSPPSNAP